MSEEEILRQEELERKRKEEWWHRHPFLYIINKMLDGEIGASM